VWLSTCELQPFAAGWDDFADQARLCLYGFTTNTYYMFGEGSADSDTELAHRAEAAEGGGHHNTYTMAIAFFITQRLFVALWYLWVAALVPMIKGTMVLYSGMLVLATAIWIGSIHVAWPNQLALIFIAICLDHLGGFAIIAVVVKSKNKDSVCRHLNKVCIPAPTSSKLSQPNTNFHSNSTSTSRPQ
jgi:hypothetical protein